MGGDVVSVCRQPIKFVFSQQTGFKVLMLFSRFVFARSYLKPIVEAPKNMMDLSQDSLFDLQGIDFYGVMYSGVECVGGVTLSVYPHQAS